MTRIGMGGITLTGRDVTIPADGTELPVMIYEPIGSAPAPAVVLCPGGVGTGLFEIVEWIAAPLRDAGFLVVTMNWRSGHPEHDADDVRAAIDWIATHAEADASRIGVFGLSRGGNAALRAAARDPRLKVVVTFGPVTDLLQQAEGVRHYAPGRYKMFVDWLGDPTERKEDYRRLSAITYAGSIRQPLLMVHGLHDMHSPPEQSIWMKEAIERGGNDDIRLELMPLMSHYGDVVPNRFAFEELRAIIIPYLRERL